tara:strand:- start:4583 stop:6613 length:2031 start_codon:yes stop_codon:yes gene_type:complete
MKEDKEPKGDGITPQPTPAQEIAAKRVGSLVMQGTPGQGAKAGLTRTPQLAQPQPMSEEAYDSLRFAEARSPESEKFSNAATRASAFSGGLPPILKNPQATTETYNLQVELAGTLGSDGKPYLSAEDWKTGPGIFGRKTRMALAKREADRKKSLGVLQAEVDQRQRILDQYGDDPDGRAQHLFGNIQYHKDRLETAKRKLQAAQQQFAPTAQQPAPAPAPAAPQPAPVDSQPAQAEEQPVDTRQPAEADESIGVAPRFEANVPEAPPVTKAMRFEKAVADAGFDKFGGDMDFMRATAKFADTEEEVKMVLSAMDLVKVPPRTIGDLLTGAHKDRFRKEIMGLFPKLKAAPKPVSDLDKARAGYARAGTKLREEQTKKVQADVRKLKGGTKGTGKRGRTLFIKRVDEAVSQVKKQISSRSTAIEANRAEYRRLKDLVSVAETEEREAKKSLDDALIDDAAFQQVKKRADKARSALGDFDTRTSYTKQSAELDDLRKQASQLGALGDQAARNFNTGLWDKLAEQRVRSGESLAVRRERMESIVQAGEQAQEQANQEADTARQRARQKQLLDRYKNSSRFETDFQNYARRAGVSKTPVTDIQKIRQGTLGIEDQDVFDIAAAAGRDFGDPFAYINEVFFAEDNPGGVPLNPPEGVNKYETAQTYRELQGLLQQGYTPRR